MLKSHCPADCSIDGPATENARPPTLVDSLMDGWMNEDLMVNGTSRRLERAEWRERRLDRSATRTSRLRYVGADLCTALYISTATLNVTLSGKQSQYRGALCHSDCVILLRRTAESLYTRRQRVASPQA